MFSYVILKQSKTSKIRCMSNNLHQGVIALSVGGDFVNDMVHADSSRIAQLLTNISLKWLKKVLLLPFYYSLVVYVVNCPPVDHGYDFHREVARISKIGFTKRTSFEATVEEPAAPGNLVETVELFSEGSADLLSSFSASG